MVQALPELVPDPGGAGSISSTRNPRSCAQSAVAVPTMPAPMIATS